MNIILCIYSKINIERGDKKMKINRQKYELARARACKGQKDLEADGIPKGTLCRIITWRCKTRNSRQDCSVAWR